MVFAFFDALEGDGRMALADEAATVPGWIREASDPALLAVWEELCLGRGVAAVEKARALLRDRDPGEPRAAGRRVALGSALVLADDPALLREAVRILADAASAAEHARLPSVLAEARVQGGRARARSGEGQAAIAGIEAGLEGYRALGDQPGVARALLALGTARAAYGDAAQGARELMDAAQGLVRTGAPASERQAVFALSAAASRRAGDLESARRAAIAARAAADEGEDARSRASTRVVEAELRHLAGDLDGARKTAEAALELARAAGDRLWGARALATLGAVKSDSGDRRAARDLLERAARAAQGVSALVASHAAALRAALATDADDVRSACDQVSQAVADVLADARTRLPPAEAPHAARAAAGAQQLAQAALALVEKRPEAAALALDAARVCEAAAAWDLSLRARVLGVQARLASNDLEGAHAAAEALEAAGKAVAAPLAVAQARVFRSTGGAGDANVFRDVATQAERRGALPLARDAYRELARAATGELARQAAERAAALDANLRARAPSGSSEPPPAPAGEDALERDDLVRLVRLLGRLSEANEPESALADVVDGAVELTGARRGLVYLRGPGGAFVLSARGRGGAALDPEEETASATIVRAAVEGGALVATVDASRDDRFKGASSVLALGSAAVLCSPLLVRGKAIGALYVDAPGEAASFDPRARALLERFASAAGLAVSAARERRLLDRLLESTLEVDELLDSALALLVELTGAGRGRVVLVHGSASEPELRVRAARGAAGPSGETDAREAALPRTALLEAARLGAAVVIEDAHREGLDTADARSLVVAPVVSGTRTLAVLLLEHREPRAFSSADRDLVARAARRIGRPLANALAHHELAREKDQKTLALEETLRRLGESESRHRIVGDDEKIRRALGLVARVRDHDVPVLVHGESGTGKELFARALHFGSKRRERPFVAQSCGGLGGPLLESELFGHEKGAFTGATSDRVGIFEAADGGTLLLDEVADLAPDVQAKLLRVLETGEVRPLGSAAAQARKVDVRVVATSRSDLKALVECGAFRQDLYYRLSTVQLEIPPLRQRRDDVPRLAEAFLARFASERGEAARALTPGALRHLVQHDWPGNVRELENAIARALALATGDKVTADDLVLEVTGAGQLPPPAAALAELTRRQEAAVEAARDGRRLTAASYRDLVRVSRRTAIRDLNELVDLGYLLREGRGSAVTYRIVPGK